MDQVNNKISDEDVEEFSFQKKFSAFRFPNCFKHNKNKIDLVCIKQNCQVGQRLFCAQCASEGSHSKNCGDLILLENFFMAMHQFAIDDKRQTLPRKNILKEDENSIAIQELYANLKHFYENVEIVQDKIRYMIEYSSKSSKEIQSYIQKQLDAMIEENTTQATKEDLDSKWLEDWTNVFFSLVEIKDKKIFFRQFEEAKGTLPKLWNNIQQLKDLDIQDQAIEEKLAENLKNEYLKQTQQQTENLNSQLDQQIQNAREEEKTKQQKAIELQKEAHEVVVIQLRQKIQSLEDSLLREKEEAKEKLYQKQLECDSLRYQCQELQKKPSYEQIYITQPLVKSNSGHQASSYCQTENSVQIREQGAQTMRVIIRDANEIRLTKSVQTALVQQTDREMQTDASEKREGFKRLSFQKKFISKKRDAAVQLPNNVETENYSRSNYNYLDLQNTQLPTEENIKQNQSQQDFPQRLFSSNNNKDQATKNKINANNADDQRMERISRYWESQIEVLVGKAIQNSSISQDRKFFQRNQNVQTEAQPVREVGSNTLKDEELQILQQKLVRKIKRQYRLQNYLQILKLGPEKQQFSQIMKTQDSETLMQAAIDNRGSFNTYNSDIQFSGRATIDSDTLNSYRRPILASSSSNISNTIKKRRPASSLHQKTTNKLETKQIYSAYRRQIYSQLNFSRY